MRRSSLRWWRDIDGPEICLRGDYIPQDQGIPRDYRDHHRRPARCGSDGPHLPRGAVAQLATRLYVEGRAREPDMACELVGAADLNPRPLSPRRRPARASLLYGATATI
jgi:hypothetical protein